MTNNGTDQPHVVPMLKDIAVRTGRTPDEYLIDGGFVTLENIEVVAERGAMTYAPLPSRGIRRSTPTSRRRTTARVAAWRLRMKTEDAKRIYVQRGAMAERTNADLRGCTAGSTG